MPNNYWIVKKQTNIYINIIFTVIFVNVFQIFNPYLHMIFLNLKLTQNNVTHKIFYYSQMFFYSIMSSKIFTWKNILIFLGYYYDLTLLSLKKL